MPMSRITGLVKGFKNLTNLTSIDLSFCENLTKVPDLSELPNLQILDLRCSRSLVEVHPSVGFLDKLWKLNFDGCSSLLIFPTRVSWKSMRELRLEYCRSLENFVEIMDKIDCLWRLSLYGTGIKQLPSSIGYLTSLRKLDMSGTPIEELPSSIGNLIELEELDLHRCVSLRDVPQSIYGLQHLSYLNLSGCPNLVVFPTKASFEVPAVAESLPLVFPANSNFLHNNYGSLQLFPSLTNLQFAGCNLLSAYDFLASLDCLFTFKGLNLSRSNFVSLPICIRKFVELRHLNLHGCKSLREILEHPPYIEMIDVGGCVSLKKFPTFFRILEFNDTQCLNSMNLSNCHSLLVDNIGVDVLSKMADAVELNVVVSKMAKAIVLNQVYKKSEIEVILPGSEVPKWFDWRKGEVCVLMRDWTRDNICELSIEIPRSLKWKNTGLAVCAVFEATQDCSGEFSFGLHVSVNEVSMEVYRLRCDFEATVTEPSGHVWLKYIPLIVDIKKEVDAESDQWTPYSCQLSFFNLGGQGFLFRGCGVHLASVPYDDEDVALIEDSSNVSISELGLSCYFDEAEAATVSTSSLSVLSGGGISNSIKRGVEHCDHDGEPGSTKDLNKSPMELNLIPVEAF